MCTGVCVCVCACARAYFTHMFEHATVCAHLTALMSLQCSAWRARGGHLIETGCDLCYRPKRKGARAHVCLFLCVFSSRHSATSKGMASLSLLACVRVHEIRGGGCTGFRLCDSSVREKDCRCRAPVTSARLPWWTHFACIPRLRVPAL